MWDVPEAILLRRIYIGESGNDAGKYASLKQVLEDSGGNFEVGTAYYPAVNEDDKGGVSIGGASLWALNNKDEKKDGGNMEIY